jgi:hypothetical protein
MNSRSTGRDRQRLCEWASLIGDDLPDEYGPCSPEKDG